VAALWQDFTVPEVKARYEAALIRVEEAERKAADIEP
jgi:hypothetical protein